MAGFRPDPAGHGGVCLHGHTHYSEESLEFLPRYLGRAPGVRTATEGIDFSRAFFTPPLAPAAAWELERRQIADLNLDALISLTDHDNVEAGMALRAQGEIAAPISVEWTVPYQRSIFHLGIHNLPDTSARSWMAVMAAYTASPDESLLPQILGELAALPETLIVLNHPVLLRRGLRRKRIHPRSTDCCGNASPQCTRSS